MARRVEREPGDFTDHAGKAGTAQTFFHCRKHIAVVPGLAVDDAVGVQTDARERGGEEIAPAQTPEHRPRDAREYAGREKRRNCCELAGGTALDHFMQMAE